MGPREGWLGLLFLGIGGREDGRDKTEMKRNRTENWKQDGELEEMNSKVEDVLLPEDPIPVWETHNLAR